MLRRSREGARTKAIAGIMIFPSSKSLDMVNPFPSRHRRKVNNLDGRAVTRRPASPSDRPAGAHGDGPS